jgi:hypothetical protein
MGNNFLVKKNGETYQQDKMQDYGKLTVGPCSEGGKVNPTGANSGAPDMGPLKTSVCLPGKC